MTRRLLVLGAIACLILAGCGPTEPIRLGFIGGLSDRNSDNGQSGQNGVILAIEQFNRAGGLQKLPPDRPTNWSPPGWKP